MMIAALWANSGFEGDEGAKARSSAIEDLEMSYDEAVEKILTGRTEAEEEIDENNPFFAQAKKGLEKVLAPRNDEGGRTVGQTLSDENAQHLDVDQ